MRNEASNLIGERFPAKTRVRILFEKRFPPRREFEFNLAKGRYSSSSTNEKSKVEASKHQHQKRSKASIIPYSKHANTHRTKAADIEEEGQAIMTPNSKVNPILKKDPHFQNSTAAASNGGGGGGGGEVSSAAAKSPLSSPAVQPGTSSDNNNSNNNPDTTPGKEKKHLKWDEHAIEEHDLLRGTRMKVWIIYHICHCSDLSS